MFGDEKWNKWSTKPICTAQWDIIFSPLFFRSFGIDIHIIHQIRISWAHIHAILPHPTTSHTNTRTHTHILHSAGFVQHFRIKNENRLKTDADSKQKFPQTQYACRHDMDYSISRRDDNIVSAFAFYIDIKLQQIILHTQKYETERDAWSFSRAEYSRIVPFIQLRTTSSTSSQQPSLMPNFQLSVGPSQTFSFFRLSPHSYYCVAFWLKAIMSCLWQKDF